MGKQQSGWFKVWTDILDDVAIAHVGNEGLGIYMKLLALLNRFGSRDGEATIGLSHLLSITDSGNVRGVLSKLRPLETFGLVCFKFGPSLDQVSLGFEANLTKTSVKHCRYCVAKWAERQEFRSKTKPPPKTKTKTKTKKEPKGKKEALASNPNRTFHPLPDLPAEFLARLVVVAEEIGCPRPSDAVRFALERVRSYSAAEGSPGACRRRTLRGWKQFAENSMRPKPGSGDRWGWALDGYQAELDAQTRAEVEAFESRHQPARVEPPASGDIPESLRALTHGGKR